MRSTIRRAAAAAALALTLSLAAVVPAAASECSVTRIRAVYDPVTQTFTIVFVSPGPFTPICF